MKANNFNLVHLKTNLKHVATSLSILSAFVISQNSYAQKSPVVLKFDTSRIMSLKGDGSEPTFLSLGYTANVCTKEKCSIQTGTVDLFRNNTVTLADENADSVTITSDQIFGVLIQKMFGDTSKNLWNYELTPIFGIAPPTQLPCNLSLERNSDKTLNYKTYTSGTYQIVLGAEPMKDILGNPAGVWFTCKISKE